MRHVGFTAQTGEPRTPPKAESADKDGAREKPRHGFQATGCHRPALLFPH